MCIKFKLSIINTALAGWLIIDAQMYAALYCVGCIVSKKKQVKFDLFWICPTQLRLLDCPKLYIADFIMLHKQQS